LGDGRVLVRILVYRGVIVRILGSGGIIVHSVVRNLRVGCILASEVNSKAAWVCGTNSVKWVSYKARNPVKFKGGKEVAGFDIIQDLLFGPFRLVLLLYYVV
jgi:hypothetical protein